MDGSPNSNHSNLKPSWQLFAGDSQASFPPCTHMVTSPNRDESHLSSKRRTTTMVWLIAGGSTANRASLIFMGQNLKYRPQTRNVRRCQIHRQKNFYAQKTKNGQRARVVVRPTQAKYCLRPLTIKKNLNGPNLRVYRGKKVINKAPHSTQALSTTTLRYCKFPRATVYCERHTQLWASC